MNHFHITVTISGADDAVPVKDLAALTVEFPFVEWGILISEKRAGTPRYPQRSWIEAWSSWPGRIAAHLCGEDARRVLRGEDHWVLESERFRRIQVNGYETMTSGLLTLGRDPLCRFILQCRREVDLQRMAGEADRIRGDVLFDPSGGRGVAPVEWPATPLGCRLGFAGGIGPDNVRDVIIAIGERSAPFWIDMETRVRDQHDAFDLGRVRMVLNHVATVNRRLDVAVEAR